MTNTQLPESVSSHIPQSPVTHAGLADMVESARRAKGTSPYVGVATGKGTVMLQRGLLKRSLQGLRIVDAELIVRTDSLGNPYSEGKLYGQYRELLPTQNKFGPPAPIVLGSRVSYNAQLAIRVYAVAVEGSAKATRLYLHQAGWKHCKLHESWVRDHIRSMGRCDCWEFRRLGTCEHCETHRPKVKLSKHETAIKKLEKQLSGMREWRPGTPCVVGTMDSFASDAQRRDEMLWKLQKPARREVMRIARDGTRRKTRELYAEIEKLRAWQYVRTNAQETMDWINHTGRFKDRGWDEKAPLGVYELRESEVSVQKWSDLSKHARDKVGGDLFDYLKVIWKFCGLVERPARELDDGEWGSGRYKSWLVDLRARKEVLSMIEGLKAENVSGGGR